MPTAQEAPTRHASQARVGWDPFLVALGAYVVVSIGRIHQLVPPLAIIRPAILAGVSMLALFFATRRVGAGWKSLDPAWKFCVLGIAVWSALGVPLGINVGVSFKMWKDTVVQSCALGIVVAIGMRGPEDVRRIISVLVLSVGFYSIRILQTFGFDLNERFDSLYSYDTNDFAHLVVCALPLALYLAVSARTRAAKAGYLLLVGLYLTIIIKSGSRGGFLGLVAVGAVALTSWNAVSARMRMVVLAGAAAFMMLFGSAMFKERVISLFHAKSDYNVTEDTGRIQAWKRGLGYMLDFPLLGVGVGAFGVAEGRLSDLAVAARQSGRANVRWMAAHNSFVEIGAEMGVPGLLLFGSLCVLLFSGARRLARTVSAGGRPDQMALLGGALLLSVIGFYVTAFFLSQSYAAHLFLLAGLIEALGKRPPSTSPLPP